jgi:hypothetical protein
MGKAVRDMFQDGAWESSMYAGEGVCLECDAYVGKGGRLAMVAVSGGSADFLITSAHGFDLDGQ